MNPVLNGGGADIMGGMLMFDYAGGASPAATVQSLLAQSFHAGAFDTGKFQSSAATTQLCLGWIDNTGSSKISVVYTIYGDANLDGTTDFSDLGKLLAHYNQPGVWADGDFNYDGMVDFSDLGKLLANYNKSRDSILLQVAGDNIVSQAAALVQESAMTVSAASSATTTATVDAASSAIDDIAAPVASHRPAHSGLAAASSKARDRYVFSRAAAVAQAFADTDLSSDLGDDDVTDTVAKATTATTYAWRAQRALGVCRRPKTVTHATASNTLINCARPVRRCRCPCSDSRGDSVPARCCGPTVSSSPPVSFCRWAGCVRMNSSLTAGMFRSRISPKFTPIRTLDSRCIVSSELIV